MRRWRGAMSTALYGPTGFYRRHRPADHFRTSVLASPLFAEAIGRLLARLDEALGNPTRLDLVDIGAGQGELLDALLAGAGASLRRRLRPYAVEVAPPTSPHWGARLPEQVTGLLLGTEWLDNVPVDLAEADPAGTTRYVLVDPATGAEALGEPVTGPDAQWLARWWPLTVPGSRAEIGRPRDEAWAGAVATVVRGAALAVDYCHLADDRPPFGTLTGFRRGQQVAPVPDGSADLTAHVALDAIAHAGQFALHTDTHHAGAGVSVCRAHAGPVLVRQAAALASLGVTGARPPLALAHQDPAGYLRRLAAASAAAELTDPAGLGGHYWLLQPVDLPGVTGWLT